ncbi:MAG: 3-deoxy-D-manno-octulosonic acid transferase [Acidobacteriaceae bacterium]
MWFEYSQQGAGNAKDDEMRGMMMLVYSMALALGLALSSPWWLLRMATTNRYREGLRERLGAVPERVLEEIGGGRVVWVHAVSVGEVLAASRLVEELEQTLTNGGGPAEGKVQVVVSTTSRTGQALARQRFGAGRVFYMPLDFAFAVRAYLRALRPVGLILMENELWPRLLQECARDAVPVVVANARVSDRSLQRAMRMHLRWLWRGVVRKPRLWLAQSEQDALRLRLMGVDSGAMLVTGNMKYDIRAPRESGMAERIRGVAKGRPVVVAGSTVEGSPTEEELVMGAWLQGARKMGAMLVLAPRHPERFAAVEAMLQGYRYAKASDWRQHSGVEAGAGLQEPRVDGAEADGMAEREGEKPLAEVEVLLLDTIGDLAGVYAIADVAFVGGSLVRRGGHNPIEPAQFGVPVVMGDSFENFRDVVVRMREAGGIRMVHDREELGAALEAMLADRAEAAAMGARGRMVFEQQQGATVRTVRAILEVIAGGGR